MPGKGYHTPKALFLLACLLTAQLTFTQNLVPNSGFEDYSTLPTGAGQWFTCNKWNNVNLWPKFEYPYASPDYFHYSGGNLVQMPVTHFATVYPHSGDAVMGFLSWHEDVKNFREYLSIQLSSPMTIDSIYRISFWITNGNQKIREASSTDHIGIQFSTSPLYQSDHEPIEGTPQIEIQGEVWEPEWRQYSFTFKADSAYNQLTFGNFYDDASTSTTQRMEFIAGGAYYFIDDVEVALDDRIRIIGDSAICSGDSLTLKAIRDTTFRWVSSLNTDSILSTNSSLNVAPSITTTYLVYGSADTASITVTVNEHPNFDLGKDTTLCEGETLQLDATTRGAEYLWQNQSSKPNFTVSEEGVYWLTMTIENCATTDTITVNYSPVPSIGIGNDTTICRYDTLTLNVSVDGGNYLWQNESTRPIMQVTESGRYSVKVTANNCSNTKEIDVKVSDCFTLLEMPNIFTPNADRINDLFVAIISKGVTSMHTVIYNRWGQKIFETDNPLIEWDGQNVNTGTYFWTAHYVDFQGDRHTLRGTLTLIR